MRLIKFRAVADEVSPSVVWSDQTLWAQGPGEPGSAWAGGNRWIKTAGIYPAGSGQLQPQAELQIGGDWLMLDQLSSGGVICVARALGEETPEMVLLPGMVLQIQNLESLRIVAVPEQADFVECRLLIGEGVCPITTGPRMPTGQGQPVQVQRRVSGPGESWQHFGGNQVFGAGTVVPAVVTLTTWQGLRFGGGRVMCVLPSYADVQFVIGSATPPTISGATWNNSASLNGVNAQGQSGYALIGSALNISSAASVAERVTLDDDPGVYVGYPGSMGIHAIMTTLGANTATACSITGAIRLRAEAE